MNQTIDMSKVGACVGTMRYGNVVQFWCESLDGGASDCRIVSVEFPTEQIAEAVAKAGAYTG